MSKPIYRPNTEVELWQWFNANQNSDMDFDTIGVVFGISGESAKKLHLLWASGSKDSFVQSFYRLFDNSPTSF
jgi:hypothetical protein